MLSDEIEREVIECIKVDLTIARFALVLCAISAIWFWAIGYVGFFIATVIGVVYFCIQSRKIKRELKLIGEV